MDVTKTRNRFQGDIDGFVSGSMEMAKGGTGSVHTICPVELHINGNRAVSESIGSISIRFSYNGLLFISRLECVDGKWKLLTLEAIYDRDSIIPTLPSFQPGELPVPKGGRESYKCITWVLSQKGFKIKQDLPGVDEPHRYIGLMKEHLEWLF
ncbi:hypothetical protein N7455_007588 [Penicillium solitum]|uniref:uncharacterized protein n=1 Tax=Penicillium solitum TaxID=60172 RepID=UPI0032C3F8FA|nr:hypothetical protein N7455_007588 [Penicillium solitum]